MISDLVPYVLGIAFLVFCVFGVPLLQKRAHERMLRGLGLEGVTLVPRFWSMSGLRIERAQWKGEVFFAGPRMGGGRPGHLRLVAEFRVLVPLPVSEESRLRTGDAAFDDKIKVDGDPGFARKLLVPEMRERLLQLDGMGGRVLGIGEGGLEIDGPLPPGAPELKRFLELSDAIVRGTVAAAGG